MERKLKKANPVLTDKHLASVTISEKQYEGITLNGACMWEFWKTVFKIFDVCKINDDVQSHSVGKANLGVLLAQI
jgi:hypothetical protein